MHRAPAIFPKSASEERLIRPAAATLGASVFQVAPTQSTLRLLARVDRHSSALAAQRAAPKAHFTLVRCDSCQCEPHQPSGHVPSHFSSSARIFVPRTVSLCGVDNPRLEGWVCIVSDKKRKHGEDGTPPVKREWLMGGIN